MAALEKEDVMKNFIRALIIFILGLALALLEVYLCGTYDFWKNMFAFLGGLFLLFIFVIGLIWTLIDDDEPEKDPQDG